MLVFATVVPWHVGRRPEQKISARSSASSTALTYHAAVYPGDTLTATSTVRASRLSTRDPKQAICTAHTKGFNQKEQMVDRLRDEPGSSENRASDHHVVH